MQHKQYIAVIPGGTETRNQVLTQVDFKRVGEWSEEIQYGKFYSWEFYSNGELPKNAAVRIHPDYLHGILSTYFPESTLSEMEIVCIKD